MYNHDVMWYDDTYRRKEANLEHETATRTSLRGCSKTGSKIVSNSYAVRHTLNHDNYIQTRHLWRNPATSCRDTSTTGRRPRQSFYKMDRLSDSALDSVLRQGIV